ncbi:MAG: SsrA-binding protein SmpB [bacterium]
MKEIINKRAYFDYEITEKFQAGVVLIGQEVKSIKTGRINLAGSYVVPKQAQPGKQPEFYLIGANIPPYQPKNAPSSYNPNRSRQLLLRKEEIKRLIGKTGQKGLTLVPIRIYTINGKIKLEFGIGKGKRKADKREAIKKRDTKREIEKALKTRG